MTRGRYGVVAFDRTLHKRMKAEAKRAGKSLPRWLADLARREMRRAVAARTLAAAKRRRFVNEFMAGVLP